MIDSNIYEKTGEGKGAPKTGGGFQKKRWNGLIRSWKQHILQAFKSSRDASNLLAHHEFNLMASVVDNASDLKAILINKDNVTLGFQAYSYATDCYRKMSADRSYTRNRQWGRFLRLSVTTVNN